MLLCMRTFLSPRFWLGYSTNYTRLENARRSSYCAKKIRKNNDHKQNMSISLPKVADATAYSVAAPDAVVEIYACEKGYESRAYEGRTRLHATNSEAVARTSDRSVHGACGRGVAGRGGRGRCRGCLGRRCCGGRWRRARHRHLHHEGRRRSRAGDDALRKLVVDDGT